MKQIEHPPESRLQLMADALPSLVSYVGRDLRYIFVNACYEKWFGIPSDKIIGMHMRDLIGADAFHWAEPFILKTLDGVATRHEKLIPMPHGLRNVVAEYIPDAQDDGRMRGFFIIAHDLTEQRKTESFLRDQQKHLRILTDAIPSAISYVDRDFRFLFVNATYYEWFGIPVEKIVGQTVEELLGPETFASRVPYLQRALNGETVQCELEFPPGIRSNRPKNGSGFADARFIPDFDIHGQVRGIVCSLTDITEFRLSTQRAEEAAKARDEFISVASHELKTPLTSLRLQEQLISRKVRERGIRSMTSDQILRMLENSERQTDRLLRLVEDMLEMSRIVHKKFIIRPEPTRLHELVEDCLERLQPQLDLTGCTIFRNIERIEGNWDRYRIEQIFINLMTNAMKYGFGKPILVRTFKTDDDVVLEVTDQGVGIEPAAQDRIFERFERAISSNEISGLGMGLYISRELARAHGGVITVQSQLGHGAVFTVRLPRITQVKNQLDGAASPCSKPDAGAARPPPAETSRPAKDQIQ